MSFANKFLSSGIALALLGAMTSSWAQDAETTDENSAADTAVIEEVVVLGIRNSLRDAIDIKRSNVGTMEAISAEDFGKFPDGNLAESLARVSGVAIDRSNVEGQAIAVRGFGPEFNLVTLNGRQMPTAPAVWEGGRSFNFGDIATPGIAAVEVYKSANSALPSGGIGATVNMVTTKPLNIDGTKKTFSLGLVEDSTTEASGTPIEAALLFATNQGRWGASISAAYQERSNREEGTRESNWITPELMQLQEGYLRVDSSNPNYTNNNTREDGYTFYQEPSAYQIKDNDRTRLNGQVALQFAFTDALVATVDYTYSSVDFEAEGVMFGSWLGGWDTDNALINSNGTYTDVVVSNRSYDHEVIWQELVNTNKSLGFNLDWQINDAWNLALDAHSSSAEVDGGELDNSVGFSPDIQGIITSNSGGNSGINTFSYDVDFAPENFLATGATVRDGYKENDMEQIQINGEWLNLNSGFVTSVDFGVSHVQSDFTKIKNNASFGSQGATAADYDDALFNRTNLGDFMNSFSPDLGTEYYYAIDPQEAFAAFVANNAGVEDSDGTVCCTAGGIDSNDRVYETLNSAYIQVNMEVDIKGMPLDIVAGLRYEESETESISYYPVATMLRWDMIDGLVGISDSDAAVDAPEYGSNSNYLPSLALSLGITDNQVIRMSVSQTMARPDLFALSSQLEISNRDYFTPVATGGNPNLEPLTSNNFDLSYENYYRDESYFAINYFIKEIDNFVGTRTVPGQEINGMTDPTASAMAQMAIACVNEWVDAGRPDTGFPGDPGATGDCVSQQALWAQGWMSDFQHMGWVANALQAGVDLSAGYPWSPAECAGNGADGWWVCDPGYVDGTSADPVAGFEVTRPYNLNEGKVSGVEFSWQHMFESSPFGMQINYTVISGGDVDINRGQVGEQFLLPGLGDSGNFSVFFENPNHTIRLALNYRGETVAGFANYEQPLYVEERKQVDFSYQFRFRDNYTLFLDAANINDEPTRLYVRYPDMLFLSQDHGPVYKFGLRASF